eukprot:6186596-Pleurochrysis_carterae.AAC.1
MQKLATEFVDATVQRACRCPRCSWYLLATFSWAVLEKTSSRPLGDHVTSKTSTSQSTESWCAFLMRPEFRL